MQYIKWYFMMMITTLIICIMQFHFPMIVTIYWMVLVSGAYLCIAGIHYVTTMSYEEGDDDHPPMRAWTKADHIKYHIKGEYVIFHYDCTTCVQEEMQGCK